jgi:LPXTG-motif cell wall-anchored protein
MIIRRALAGALFGLALAAVAPLAVANAAAPAGYPQGGDAGLTVSSSVVTGGGTVTFSGSGFAANTPITITTVQTSQGFARQAATDATMGSLRPVRAAAPAVQRFAATTALLTVHTNAAGSFSTSLTFSSPGVYVVTARGLAPDGSIRTATATITVLAAGNRAGGTNTGTQTGSGTDLPNTGASVRLPITIGVILVLAGAGLLTVVRRRKGQDLAA